MYWKGGVSYVLKCGICEWRPSLKNHPLHLCKVCHEQVAEEVAQVYEDEFKQISISDFFGFED